MFFLCFVFLLLYFIFYLLIYHYSGVLLIDNFDMYSRMMLVEEVCKHSYISSNSSVQPSHECLVITGMARSCCGRYSLLFIFGMLVE